MIYKPAMLAGSLAAAAFHAADGAYYELVQPSRASNYGRNLYSAEKVLDPSENTLHGNRFPYDFELPPTLQTKNSDALSQVKNRRRQRMKYADIPAYDYYHQEGVRKMREQHHAQGINKIGEADMNDMMIKEDEQHYYQQRVNKIKEQFYQQGVNKMGEANMKDMDNKEDQQHAESIHNVEQIKNPLARLDMQRIRNIIPNLTKSFNNRNPNNNNRRQSFLTPMNVGFIVILLVLIGKVLLSVLMASGFVIAGQALYSFAQMTGTTAVFGMDSTITIIYKTLPLVEALLRGDTDIAGREAATLIETLFG